MTRTTANWLSLESTEEEIPLELSSPTPAPRPQATARQRIYLISDLARNRRITESLALDLDDAQQAITLALLTLGNAPGISLYTDGMFGLTRSKQSTCTIQGFISTSYATDESQAQSEVLSQASAVIRHIRSITHAGGYRPDPEVIDAKQAHSDERNATTRIRREANKQRNRDSAELIALIKAAGLPHAQTKALIGRVKFVELPELTASRELFKHMQIWGLVSHVQNPHAVPWESIRIY